MAPFAPILNYPPTVLGVHLGDPCGFTPRLTGWAEVGTRRRSPQSLEAAPQTGRSHGWDASAIRSKPSPEPRRGHYVKLLDDYLDLLKQTTVVQEGEIVAHGVDDRPGRSPERTAVVGGRAIAGIATASQVRGGS